jgi:hypothetical protein
MHRVVIQRVDGEEVFVVVTTRREVATAKRLFGGRVARIEPIDDTPLVESTYGLRTRYGSVTVRGKEMA